MLSFLSLIDNEEQRSLCERLYYDYSGEMLTVAFNVLNDASEAEDIVHDVFVYIAKNAMDSLEKHSEAQRRFYLLIATRHRAWNRAKMTSRLMSLDELEEKHKFSVPNDGEFLRRLEAQSSVNKVKACISKLPPIYRDTLFLRFISNLRGKEISDLLDISQDAVWQRIRRGKLLLSELMEKEEGDRE